ncbi:MAG: lipocalin-like domain-containing protein, partial [Candidatus Promineifilaceae bacterium]
EEKASAIDGYVSYSGTFRTKGQLVIHSVTFSLLPNWIGTDLIREMRWTEDDPQQLVLSTTPQTTRSGKQVVNRLRWQKLPE